MIWGDERRYKELSYVVPKGIPYSEFLGWSSEDQDWALAYEAEMRKVCSGCGTRKTEWEKDRFAYVGQTERCPGCELIEMEKVNLEDTDSKGVKIYLAPRATAKPPDESLL